jgi:hypothetical protein
VALLCTSRIACKARPIISTTQNAIRDVRSLRQHLQVEE